MSEEADKILLETAQHRLQLAIEEDEENRKLALEDLEFISDGSKQWPEDVARDRLAFNRPCISVNKMPAFIDQVVGDQRMNRPAIKVIPVDSRADKEVARILGGWIKHVQQISKSDVAVDHGFEHAVSCGYGALRVVTEYTSDSSFEQEAFIRKIDNALSVYWGPHSEYDCSDAPYCFLITDMDREEFKNKYKLDPIPFNTSNARYVDGWCTKNTVRVAEYFVKEPVVKTIYQLNDGRVVDEVSDDALVVNQRKVNTYKIMWYLISGDAIIDRTEWVGRKYIPVIPIWGKELYVGGKRVIRGLIRHGKDSQRMYNYWRSCDTETIALQPRNPYLLTPRQIEGHEAMWADAQKRNYQYLLVNVDKDAPGWPQRQDPPKMSSAIVETIRETDQEIRDTVGLQKASLGMQSNERSGKAIIERKREGDVGTFAFIDNLSRSLEHVGRVLVDIAPRLLDTQRQLRLGLDDGDFEFVKVNATTPDGGVINDLSVGTYDVVVDVGPSYSTQRVEAQQSMREFIQYYPAAAAVIGDLYAKAMDWHGAEEVAERLEFLLPPEIKASLDAKKAAREGQVVQPTQPQPNPEQIMQSQEMDLRLKEMNLKVQQEEVKLEGLKIKNEILQNTSKESVKKLIDEIMAEENGNASNKPKAAEINGDSETLAKQSV